MSSSLSRSNAKDYSERRVYVTGYSLKEQSEDMRKIFEKYGEIQEFSWKGRFFFIVTPPFLTYPSRPIKREKTLTRQLKK